MPSTERMTGEQWRAAMGAQPTVKARAASTETKSQSKMNGNERAYGAYLAGLKLAGLVLDYGYQKITLKLADDTRFTPDYHVLLPDFTIKLVDCKGKKKNKATGEMGYWTEEDAKIKIKVAAEQFPIFRFAVAWKAGGSWEHKDFS